MNEKNFGLPKLEQINSEEKQVVSTEQENASAESLESNEPTIELTQESIAKQEKSKQIAEEKLFKLMGNKFTECGIRFMSKEEFKKIAKDKSLLNEKAELYSLDNWQRYGKHHLNETGEEKERTIADYILRHRYWDQTADKQTRFIEANQPLRGQSMVATLFFMNAGPAFEKYAAEGGTLPIKELRNNFKRFWDDAEKIVKKILSKPDVEKRNDKEVLDKIKEIIENPDLIKQLKYVKVVQKFLSYNSTMINECDWEKIRPNLQKDHYEVATIIGGPLESWQQAHPRKPHEDENWKVVGNRGLDDGKRLLGVIVALRDEDLMKEIRETVSEAEDFSCPVINANAAVKYPRSLDLKRSTIKK
jgi:hypothetical protein